VAQSFRTLQEALSNFLYPLRASLFPADFPAFSIAMFVPSLLAVAAATASLATAQAPPEAIIEDSLQKRNESACGYFFNDQYKDAQGKKDQPDHGQLLQANGGCVPFVDADGTINRDTKYVVVKNNAACLRCTFWA
jgi:hypothetical protein